MIFRQYPFIKHCEIITREGTLVTAYLKLFMLLLSRDCQMLYDYRTKHLYELYRSLMDHRFRPHELKMPVSKKRKQKQKILWHLKPERKLLLLYPMTT